MEMKWGERGKERERDGVGCVGMAWPPSNTTHSHTRTHKHNLKYTNMARESSKVCPDGILLRCTALFKGLIDPDNTVRSTKGHHQPMLREQPGQCNNRCHQMKSVLSAQCKRGIFLICYSWVQKVASYSDSGIHSEVNSFKTKLNKP